MIKPGTGRLCFAYGAPGAAGNGCGPAPRTALPEPLVDGGSYPDRVRIFGLTTGSVDRVRLFLPGGRTLSAETHAAPLFSRLRVYALEFRSRLIARLHGPAATLVAYDVSGKVVARRRV